MQFSNYSIFYDTSYLILNNFFDLSPTLNPISLNISVDWQSGEFTIGLAYSLNEGLTWISIWEQQVTEDIPATQIFGVQVPNENYVKLALYCTSTTPNSIGYWFIDDLILDTPLSVGKPPPSN